MSTYIYLGNFVRPLSPVQIPRMYRRLAACVGFGFLVLLLITTGTSRKVEIDSYYDVKTYKDNTKSIRFLIVGDTGGLPILGNSFTQTDVAKQMNIVAEREQVQYVLNSGDNIYFTGVSDEFDKQFKSSFEKPYDYEFLDIPWFMIAGNHDHFGNVTGETAYTKRKDKPSNKWQFPDFYYKKSFIFGTTTVDVLMLDTIILCGNTRDIQMAGFFDMVKASSHHPDTPADKREAEKEWRWIEQQLANSTADYLFVVGHYPMHSISSHGPTECLKERLDPLLRKNKASVYFSGHDHTLQHISIADDSGYTMEYVVSGAASRSDRSTKHIHTVKPQEVLFRYPTGWFNFVSQLGIFGDGGFVFMDVRKDKAELQFFDKKGEMLYSFYVPHRNKSLEVEV